MVKHIFLFVESYVSAPGDCKIFAPKIHKVPTFPTELFTMSWFKEWLEYIQHVLPESLRGFIGRLERDFFTSNTINLFIFFSIRCILVGFWVLLFVQFSRAQEEWIVKCESKLLRSILFPSHILWLGNERQRLNICRFPVR